MGCGSSKSMTKNIIPVSLQNPYLPPGTNCAHCDANHQIEKQCSKFLKHRRKAQNGSQMAKRGMKGSRIEDHSEKRRLNSNILTKKSTHFLDEENIEELESFKNRPQMISPNPPSMCQEDESSHEIEIIEENEGIKIEKLRRNTLPDFDTKDIKLVEKKFVESDEELDELLEMKGYMSPIYLIPGKYNPENFDDIEKKEGVKEILEIGKTANN